MRAVDPAATPPDYGGVVTFDHKLHKPAGLLACGYYSRRGYAAPYHVIESYAASLHIEDY